LLVDVDANLPALWVEASQIERVIANLVDNATKYSPPESSVRILGRLLGSAIVLRVEDEGLGIPPRDLERIFEPFFRETGGGWPAKPGTGLGLAVCRGIVEAHGGQIRAENRAERGAAFVVTLPAEGALRR
jgi:two-component system sensor histidine kinase KdpD